MEKNDDYGRMRLAQDFFRLAIEAILSTDKAKLSSLVEDLVLTSSKESFPYSHSDIVEEFQSEGRTLLHVAAGKGDVNILTYILDLTASKTIINKQDKNGITPLMQATIAESSPAMELLISRGSDVNISNHDGSCCVHVAAADGSVERLDMLVTAGADLSISSGAGTPLHWAAGKGREDTVRYLITRSFTSTSASPPLSTSLAPLTIDINACNSSGVPAIVMAAAARSDGCVAILLEAGAAHEHLLPGSLTLLHMCAENGLTRSVAALLSEGLGLRLNDVATSDGNHPIHLAAMSGHREIVAMLLPFSSAHISRSAINIEDIMMDGQIRLAQWHRLHKSGEEAEAVHLTADQGRQEEAAPFSSPVYLEPHVLEEVNRLKQGGNALFASNKYEEALEEYSSAIRLLEERGLPSSSAASSSVAALWSNRSACYMALKDYLKALKDAEVCRRMEPQWPKGCYRLAVARLAVGQYEDAAVAAFEGCKLDDSNKELKRILKEAVRLGQEEHKKKNSPCPS